MQCIAAAFLLPPLPEVPLNTTSAPCRRRRVTHDMRHTRPESAYYMRPTLQEDARPPSGVLGGPFRACGRTPIYGTHQDNANHFEVLQDLDTYLGLEFQAIVQGLNWGVVRAEPAPSMPFRGDFLGAADCNWFLDGTGCTRDGGHASLVNADPLTLEPQRQRGFGAGHSHPKDTSRGHSAAPQLQPLETAGGLYEDPEFPATKAVLGHTVDGPCEVVWARPEQFGAAPPALFSTASADEPLVAPSDIVQGIVGDCWLLCAVSVLAEDPALIRGMFRSSDADLRQGFACVRLHVDGAVQDVVVDTRFPVFHGSQGVTPCFARARGPELWVMVLEKAYAKALGHFELLNNGDPGDALADLTGAPVYAFPANGPNPDALWKRLVDGKREGFFFCASVPEDPDRDTEQTVGIVEDHAYAILDIREVKPGAGTDTGTGVRGRLGVHRGSMATGRLTIVPCTHTHTHTHTHIHTHTHTHTHTCSCAEREERPQRAEALNIAAVQTEL